MIFFQRKIRGDASLKGESGHRAGCAFQPLFGSIERLINLLAEPELHPGAFAVGREGDYFPAAHDGVPKIRQIATGGSHIHQISRVIDWIKGNLSERLRVEDLPVEL